jgi:hypothetical protein
LHVEILRELRPEPVSLDRPQHVDRHALFIEGPLECRVSRESLSDLTHGRIHPGIQLFRWNREGAVAGRRLQDELLVDELVQYLPVGQGLTLCAEREPPLLHLTGEDHRIPDDRYDPVDEGGVGAKRAGWLLPTKDGRRQRQREEEEQGSRGALGKHGSHGTPGGRDAGLS